MNRDGAGMPETGLLGDAALDELKARDRPNLLDFGREGLREALAEMGIPQGQAKMRADQIWKWVHNRGERDFGRMTNISKGCRETLEASLDVRLPGVKRRQVSRDGTRKYLLEIAGGHLVEAVFIPDHDRGALCVSSQVGCTLTCSFCHTGTQRLVRNLSPGEILGQIMVAKDDLGDWPRPGEHPAQNPSRITNIVLMGMGEPLYNFESVRDAMRAAMEVDGLCFSRRKITLSTSGVVPQIERAGHEIGCMLAVSLHATTDSVRDRLVPINRKWNIECLLGALRAYPRLSNSERITFEYVMLKGVNDSDEDARRLVGLIAGIPAKVNLIPFNSWPGAPFERSDPERIERFSEIVFRAGYASPVRTPRGEDIMAACGQLKSATERARKSAARAEAMAARGSGP